MRCRQAQFDHEENWLHPAAEKSGRSRGRVYPEAEHPLRTPFERDRDRIIHSAAFRRLEYKTQVFVNHEGDSYRTRLTHTLEVAQIARSVARFLRLNEDLAEAVALVHDIGHPPFGHSGEDALQRLMSAHGGFEHNLHALRIVDLLEQKYSDHPGLNLTWEVREGIAMHSPLCLAGDRPEILAGFAGHGPHPSLEAQVADAADAIAYNAHDIDDGLAAGMIDMQDLREVSILRRQLHRFSENGEREQQRYQLVRALIDYLITDLTGESDRRLKQLNLQSADDARGASEPGIGLSPEAAKEHQELGAFLRARVYSNFRIARMAVKAQRVIRDLWTTLAANPEQLPPGAASAGDRPERRLCDYIASLTDREALREHARLYDPLAAS